MTPGGMLKLLPLSLWLSIQYLGTNTLVETVSYCQNLVRYWLGGLLVVRGACLLVWGRLALLGGWGFGCKLFICRLST